MKKKYDFAGWATRNDIRRADGRVIMKDAFKDNDGTIVPLVWNHGHNDQENVLGHALLENEGEGVRAYGVFNDTERGRHAKALVLNGDITALSIYANKLKQQGSNVLHGVIREVSLVLGGANPGAYIDTLSLEHSDDPSYEEDEAIIYTGETLYLAHSSEDDETNEKEKDEVDNNKKKPEDEETVEDVFNTLTEKQKTVVYAVIGQALENAQGSDEEDEEEKENMKHNVFEDHGDHAGQQGSYLSHSDEEAIISLAKSSGVGSLQEAISIYAEQQGSLAHGFDADDLNYLFPDYKDLTPGAPELITRDQGWVTTVMNGVKKSPISRIRTKQMDARDKDGTRHLRARGHKKGDQKANMGNPKLLRRTTDPHSVYVKDDMHRDDIVDITDFDVVEYEFGLMRQLLNEEIATAIMLGDGRTDGDDDKIPEENIRPIWTDDDIYTIHADLDMDATRSELQGTNTSANFGEEYIYAETMIKTALYVREQYRGSGKLTYYCDDHSLNTMLLARDLNGRRIYTDVADLAKALNVKSIQTAQQFAGRTRKVVVNGVERTKLLHGIFVDLDDYVVGSVKGGEITRFDQFDIDFNKQKFLIETRLSGALTRAYSAIAVEEDITPSNP